MAARAAPAVEAEQLLMNRQELANTGFWFLAGLLDLSHSGQLRFSGEC
jgi:hypothetical protein